MSEYRRDLGYSPERLESLPLIVNAETYQKGAELLAQIRKHRDCESQSECAKRIGKCSACWKW